MPKTQLKPSPIAVVAQEFLEISLKASDGTQFGSGNLEVQREASAIPEPPRRWMVTVRVDLEADEGVPPPPYVGHITMRGVYEVAEAYPANDAARLIRVTGASMLYGCIREMVANTTARSSNGMVTLPSVSFFEKPPAAAGKKSTAKKAAK